MGAEPQAKQALDLKTLAPELLVLSYAPLPARSIEQHSPELQLSAWLQLVASPSSVQPVALSALCVVHRQQFCDVLLPVHPVLWLVLRLPPGGADLLCVVHQKHLAQVLARVCAPVSGAVWV